MKKHTIVTLSLLIFFFASDAQITKGNWMIGGNASYSSTNYKSDFGSKTKFFDLQLIPHVGYFIADKIATGIAANIVYMGFNVDASTQATSTDFNLGPFIRYYLLSTEREFNIVTEATYQYGFAGGNVGSKKPRKNTFAFAAGPVIYFTNSVGLEFLIGYSTYKYTAFAGSDNSIRFGIGIQAHLEKNK